MTRPDYHVKLSKTRNIFKTKYEMTNKRKATRKVRSAVFSNFYPIKYDIAVDSCEYLVLSAFYFHDLRGADWTVAGSTRLEA